MSLTRKMLKAMGIEEEKIDQIIDAHTETTDALKADRDKYKEEASKVPGLEKDLLDARNAADAAAKDPYKEKYESEKQAFADYKKGVEAEQEKTKKVTAYKALLKKTKVPEEIAESILEGTKIEELKLDADGNITDAEEREKAITEKWAKYIPKETVQGAGTETPPSGSGAGGRTLSRAAQVVAAHNERLYGIKAKGEETK